MYVDSLVRLQGKQMLSRVYNEGKESVVLRITPYKCALESAKVNVVGASRGYVIVWYLLPQTCTRVQPYSVPTCTARSSLRRARRIVNPRA